MLQHLLISNYALISNLEMSFTQGMTVITGETGAGKSILLGALRLCMGERANLQTLSNPDKKCVIEATFDISKLNLEVFFEENELDYEDITIIRREILPSAKSRAFVNDVPVRINILQELSNHLIDIHSQFETAAVVDQDFQLDWIDALAKNKDLLSDYQSIYHQYQTVQKEIKQLVAAQNQFTEEQEYFQFLYNELDEAQLEKEDITALEQEQKKWEYAQEITENLSAGLQIIQNEELGIESQLKEAIAKIRKSTQWLPELDSLEERLTSVAIELNDVGSELLSHLESTEIDPARQTYVYDRLNLLNELMLKHKAVSQEELIAKREEIHQKLALQLESDQKITDLKKQEKALEEKLVALTQKLQQKREKTVPILQKEVLTTLAHLGMDKSRLEVIFTELAQFGPKGKHSALIQFSANPGMPLSALENSVSGGERSRLMLAIKSSLAQSQNLPTLILDEIDTGVSGKIAHQMGNIMQQMAAHLQLIAITHLPQVAAKGNQHFKVYKSIDNQQTQTLVQELKDSQRLEEVAWLLSGDQLTNTAIDHAKELLNK